MKKESVGAQAAVRAALLLGPYYPLASWYWGFCGREDMWSLWKALIVRLQHRPPWFLSRREWYRVWLTIKDLKLIILLLTEEVLHCEGDVVFGLYSHQPRAGLELGIAPWVALTQDHTCGVCQKLIRWAVHLEKEREIPGTWDGEGTRPQTCAFLWYKRQPLESQYLSIQKVPNIPHTPPGQEVTSDSASMSPYCWDSGLASWSTSRSFWSRMQADVHFYWGWFFLVMGRSAQLK